MTNIDKSCRLSVANLQLLDLLTEYMATSEESAERQSVDGKKGGVINYLQDKLCLNCERRTVKNGTLGKRLVLDADRLALQKDRVFDLAIALTSRANAGLSFACILRSIIELCTPSAGHSYRHHNFYQEQQKSGITASGKDSECPNQESLTAEEQKKAIRLRNELFILAHRLGDENLRPQIIAFAKGASMQALEEKLAALRLLHKR